MFQQRSHLQGSSYKAPEVSQSGIAGVAITDTSPGSLYSFVTIYSV